MGPIYMVHPHHGTHIAYEDDEVARCLENGWSLRDRIETIERIEVADAQPKKRRGRPPKAK